MNKIKQWFLDRKNRKALQQYLLDLKRKGVDYDRLEVYESVGRNVIESYGKSGCVLSKIKSNIKFLERSDILQFISVQPSNMKNPFVKQSLSGDAIFKFRNIETQKKVFPLYSSKDFLSEDRLNKIFRDELAHLLDSNILDEMLRNATPIPSDKKHLKKHILEALVDIRAHTKDQNTLGFVLLSKLMTTQLFDVTDPESNNIDYMGHLEDGTMVYSLPKRLCTVDDTAIVGVFGSGVIYAPHIPMTQIDAKPSAIGESRVGFTTEYALWSDAQDDNPTKIRRLIFEKEIEEPIYTLGVQLGDDEEYAKESKRRGAFSDNWTFDNVEYTPTEEEQNDLNAKDKQLRERFSNLLIEKNSDFE